MSNTGTITTPGGTTALAAGSDVTLSFAGNSLVNLQVNQSTLNSLAENGGLIQADGGAVLMSAGARDAVLASVVNNTGIIQARSVQSVNGTIVLEAGSNGTATNSGTLDASGKNTGETGGTAKLLGGDVKLAANGKIDVSGDAGGGTAYVGGNFLGQGPEQNAKNTTVETGSSINADAINSGNGGNVAVWSDGTTQFNGSITARGGSTAGNGGQIETSGKTLKVGTTASVSTAAAHGSAGNWLLDPADITIGSSSMLGSTYSVDVESSVLTNALNNGNVTIKTSSTGTGAGDIIILDYIGYASTYDSNHVATVTYWNTNSYTLTLSAYRDITFGYLPGYVSPGAGTTIDVAGGIYTMGGHGNVVLRADNSATGTGTVNFVNNPANFILLADSASTISLYYTPTNYNSPIDYSASVISGQLSAYMAINVTGSAASKTYDGLTTTAVAGLNSSLPLPTGLTLNSSSAVGTFADKNVGTDKAVKITGVTATGSGATTTVTSDGMTTISYGGDLYYINGLDSKTATISKADLVVSGISASDKTYDGTRTATLSGTATVTPFSNEAHVVDNVLVTGTPSAVFNDKNVNTGIGVTVTGYTLGGSDANNYNVIQPTNLTASINKADLTLIGTKTYDGSTAVAGNTLTALGANGETFTVNGSGDITNLASKNVQTGSALSSVTGLALGASANGGLSTNYNALSSTGSAYTVTPKGITLTGITALDKVYDATTAATLNTSNVGYSGMISGDDIMLSGSGTGQFDRKDVGTRSVTVNGYTLSGNDAGNYVLSQPTGLTATISKANLVVSGISASDKTYDGTSSATLSGTATVTALPGDIVSAIGIGSGSFADPNAGSNKQVIVTGYSLSGLNAGNYNVVQPTGVTAAINKADLTLSGARSYNQTTAVAGSTLTATGVNGETFTVTGSGDLSNLAVKDVQTGVPLSSVTGLALGVSGNGGVSTNYNALSTTGSAYSITPASITLSGITAADKVYDASNAAALDTSNVVYSGLFSGDSVNLTGSGTGTFDIKDAGTARNVTVTGYSINGTDSGNYILVQPTGVRATISKADLAVQGIVASNKTYDGTSTATVTGTGFVNALLSDMVTVIGTGTGTFADPDAGVSKLVTITGYSLTGPQAGNYNVVQPVGVRATINKADLTLIGNKTYDGTTTVAGNTLTATGVNGETFTVNGSGDISNLVSKNVQSGSTLSSVTGLALGASSNGGLSTNYNVLSTAGSAYTVTAKGITLTGITATDKVYDATTAAALNTSNVGYSGMISGDDVLLSGSGTGQFDRKDVGTRSVTVSGYSLSGNDAGNYIVAQPTGLTATITKADLAVTGISASDKTYDGTRTATLTGTATVTGLITDVVSAVGPGSGTFSDANADVNKSVTVTGYTLTGTDAGNYNVVQPTSVTATINKANVTLSGTKTYDGSSAVAGSTLTATGVNGETFTVSGNGDTSNLSGKNVQVASTLNSVTGLALGTSSNGGLSGNYNALSTTGSAYTVTAKGITLAGITAADKTYDTTTSATINSAGVSYAGLISGDTVSLSGTGTGTFGDKNAGINKTVNVSGFTLAGTDAGNYVLTQPTGVTATISKADLAISGVFANDKTYDATTTASLGGTASVTALANDVVTVSGPGAGSFADKNAGSNKTVTAAGFTLSGADAGNYNVVQPTGLTASINKANLNVSGITAANKVEDGTTAATVRTNTATLAGLVSGDSVALASAGTFADAAVGNGKTVNLRNSISGVDSGNYLLTGQTTALADITSAAPPVPQQAIQNVVTQVQSAVLPPQAAAQPQALDLSSTIVVRQQQPQQQQESAPANNGNGEGSGNTGRSLINTSVGFGTAAPTLNIQNGGVQLPPLAVSITQ